MVIRAVIKYFRKRISRLATDLPHMTPHEEEVLRDMFTRKNYIPQSESQVFRSFNSEFRDWIFRMPSFCRAFTLFYRKYLDQTYKKQAPTFGGLFRFNLHLHGNSDH